MGQRISLFLVVLLLMFSEAIWSQKIVPLPEAKVVLSTHYQPIKYKSTFGVQPSKTNTGNVRVFNFRLTELPGPSYYPNHLGIICRTELKLDKITPVPVRFRLGSLEYVNWLERKPNAVRPQ